MLKKLVSQKEGKVTSGLLTLHGNSAWLVKPTYQYGAAYENLHQKMEKYVKN